MRRVDDSRVAPNSFARALFSPLPERYDLLSDVLSLGQSPKWRRELVSRVTSTNPSVVLDVATGTAGVAMQITKAGPAVIGIDLTPAMIERGRAIALASGQKGISFVAGTAERLPFSDESFDALCFTYLLRYVADPKSTINELARVVKPGGVMASLEFFVPRAPIFRLGWFLYTRLMLPLIGGALGGRRWFDVGRFLGPSTSAHYRSYPLSWHLDAWRSAGMTDVAYKTKTLGAAIVMWGRKASA